jgi:hypothetical protein
MAGQLPSKYTKGGNASARLNIQQEVEKALDAAIGKLLSEIKQDLARVASLVDRAERSAAAAMTAESKSYRSQQAAESALVQVEQARIKAGSQLASAKQVLKSIQQTIRE